MAAVCSTARVGGDCSGGDWALLHVGLRGEESILRLVCLIGLSDELLTSFLLFLRLDLGI